MDALKNWMHRKDHHSWTKVIDTWDNIRYATLKITDNNSLEYIDWNPWKVWCQSWEKFKSYNEKPPKSENPKATIFTQLFTLAKLTSDKLEEAKDRRKDLIQKIHENEKLKNQNFILEKRCTELQMELNIKEKMRVQNLEKEANLRTALESREQYLMFQVKSMDEKLCQERVKCSQLEKRISSCQSELVEYKSKNNNENKKLRNQHSILEKRCAELQMELNIKEVMRVQNLEKEANLRTELEDAEEVLTLQVKSMAEKLCQERAKCGQLEKMISSCQSQLVEYKSKNNYQVNIKNDFHYHERNPPSPYKQLEYGEGEKSLDLQTIKSIVERLGQVNRLNVFDWLCSCEAEYRIWNWSGKDFEKILHRCTDSSIFSSIFPIVRMTEISWLEMLKDIAERFFPNLDDVLCTEKMRKGELVLQYFNRMWMIYRCSKIISSRDESEYIEAICDGLLPHLREAVKHLRDEDYEAIIEAARSAEYSWWDSERQEQYRYWESRRAGVGCPSRVTIWRRLKKHGVPTKEIDGASYWYLLVRLSRLEDLGTGGNLHCEECN